MEIIPKSPQELVAQSTSAIPLYNDFVIPKDQADRLKQQALDFKDEIKDMKPYMMTDEQLTPKLDSMLEQAKTLGAWVVEKGDGADDRLGFAKEKLMSFGYTEEEAALDALKDVKREGYLSAIRSERRDQEKTFTEPVQEYLDNHSAESGTSVSVFDIALMDAESKSKLAADFPGGNFLYHGTNTESILKVLESGALANTLGIREMERKAAVAEGRETNIIRNNSGYEGISWSMNGIDALPGDRYHLSGFIAAPEVALGSTDQLTVPSRPAPNEVLQLSSAVDTNEFYGAKTQLELYRMPGVFGETNSLFSNLLKIKNSLDPELKMDGDKPMLLDAQEGILAEPGFEDKLRALYDVNQDGSIQLSPNLLQQVDNDIPVAAVWLQAAIDIGRLKNTQFYGKDVNEIINSITLENAIDLLRLSLPDWKPQEATLEKQEESIGAVEVPVEQMYLVAPRKDANIWKAVIAASDHKPAGILLYDDKKVRLENFATVHKGDHEELTEEIKSVIKPNKPGYIPYEEVLGTEFGDDMRTGHSHQVIAEEHLSNRSSIVNQNGKLTVKR